MLFRGVYRRGRKSRLWGCTLLVEMTPNLPSIVSTKPTATWKRKSRLDESVKSFPSQDTKFRSDKRQNPRKFGLLFLDTIEFVAMLGDSLAGFDRESTRPTRIQLLQRSNVPRLVDWCGGCPFCEWRASCHGPTRCAIPPRPMVTLPCRWPWYGRNVSSCR